MASSTRRVRPRTGGLEDRYALGMQRYLRSTVMYPPARELFARYSEPRAIERAAADPSHYEASDGRVGLYIHIPFCETRCAFCDYATLIGPSWDETRKASYVDLLVRELDLWRRALPGSIRLSGLDFGGGTPMSLSPAHVARLIAAVKSNFNLDPSFEISFETTPTLAAARPDDLAALRALGVRRLSMGVQSLDLSVLRASSRANHDPETVHRAMASIGRAGFELVNLDLMFAQLGENLDLWQRTLSAAIALEPDVLTLYDTVYKSRGIGVLAQRSGDLPSARDYADAYDLAFGQLQDAGYGGDYGTVNFSRVSTRLGTSAYLEGRILELYPYVGLGLYASSLIGDSWGFRPARLADLEAEVRAGHLPRRNVYDLPRAHIEAKSILLMLSYGFLDDDRFTRRFGYSLEDHHGAALAALCELGLLERQGHRWVLTPGSFGHLPGVRACFVPDEAAQWLDAWQDAV